MKSSGLPVWKHHEKECKRETVSEEAKLEGEIQERLRKWEAYKEAKKNKKTSCHYGCGKSWKNIHSKSVKIHVLEKCRLREGNEGKLLGFYKRQKKF